MPDPVPLEMPTEHPDAIDDLVQPSPGRRTGSRSVDERLTGAAGAAPGWLGRRRRGGGCPGAARSARWCAPSRTPCSPLSARLSGHAELVLLTRRRVEALRDEQDDQFRDAWRRWSGGRGPAAADHDRRARMCGRSSTSCRRRRGEPANGDTTCCSRSWATTQRRRRGCSPTPASRVGVRGRAGRREPVSSPTSPRSCRAGAIWSSPAAPASWRRNSRTPPSKGWETRAEQMAVYAGQPAFAGVFLAGLGRDGLREILLLLGERTFGDDLNGRSGKVGAIPGTALGAAAPTRTVRPTRCCPAVCVDVDSEGTDADLIAMGMATVLVAGAPNGGPAPMTVASWTRQVLAREHALAGQFEGASAVDRVYPNAQFDEVEWALVPAIRSRPGSRGLARRPRDGRVRGGGARGPVASGRRCWPGPGTTPARPCPASSRWPGAHRALPATVRRGADWLRSAMGWSKGTRRCDRRPGRRGCGGPGPGRSGGALT